MSSTYATRSNTKPKSASADWLVGLQELTKTAAILMQDVPVPFAQSVCAAVVSMLNHVENMRKNKDDVRSLATQVVGMMSIIVKEVAVHPTTPQERYKDICNEFVTVLKGISLSLEELVQRQQSWRKSFFRTYSIQDEISDYSQQVTNLRDNFMLATAAGTRLEVSQVNQKVTTLNTTAEGTHQKVSHMHQSMNENFRNQSQEFKRFAKVEENRTSGFVFDVEDHSTNNQFINNGGRLVTHTGLLVRGAAVDSLPRGMSATTKVYGGGHKYMNNGYMMHQHGAVFEN